MVGAYVRFKCNYAALRKSSDNQQQHLLLVQQWIIGNTMWIWLSTSSQTRIFDLWNKVYHAFGKFNSLKNTLTDSLSSCLLCLRTTYMYTQRKACIGLN